MAAANLLMSRPDSAVIKSAAYACETTIRHGMRTTGWDDGTAATDIDIDRMPWSAEDLRLRFHTISLAWLQLRVRCLSFSAPCCFCSLHFISFSLYWSCIRSWIASCRPNFGLESQKLFPFISFTKPQLHLFQKHYPPRFPYCDIQEGGGCRV